MLMTRMGLTIATPTNCRLRGCSDYSYDLQISYIFAADLVMPSGHGSINAQRNTQAHSAGNMVPLNAYQAEIRAFSISFVIVQRVSYSLPNFLTTAVFTMFTIVLTLN